ncbi:MAG: hypothetical protein Kow0069_11940 [Promethearchaeota archaeon]
MNALEETRPDAFSRRFLFATPVVVPVVVAGLTAALKPLVAPGFQWFPLLLVYWSTIWALVAVYQRARGGAFSGEKFKPTLALRGKYLPLQYLVVYGPLLYTIPPFVVNYARVLTPATWAALVVASVINGPSEEAFWRACLDEAGRRAGLSERTRLAYLPVAFALWHTAFVVHLFPLDERWWLAWVAVDGATWSSGLAWTWTLHRSGRLFPQTVYHACANLFNVFPMVLVDVLHVTS